MIIFSNFFSLNYHSHQTRFRYFLQIKDFDLILQIPFLGVEARGFMFGPSIALAIGAKFVPLRKPRKLPGKRFVFMNLGCGVG